MVNKDYKNWKSESLPTAKPTHTLFLSGDGGEPVLRSSDPYLKTLQTHLEESDSNATLLLLGDNIYPNGLPNEDHTIRKEKESVLLAQIGMYKNFRGKVYWIAGNHDWDEGHEQGWAYRLNQERFVETHSNRGNIFLPDSGCPGPVSLDLGKDGLLLLMDTQWWLHKYEKPLTKEFCDITTEEEMATVLRTELEKNKDRQIFVGAHHPMESFGPHGGKYPWRSHLFPLTEFNRKLWIPFPVLGSVYVYGRKGMRYIQDTPNKHYKRMRKSFIPIFEKHPGVTYVNGHDHSLQLITKNKVNYITSGSASQVSHVVKKPSLDFGFAGNGYVVIYIYASGEKWADFYQTTETGRKLVFRKKLE